MAVQGGGHYNPAYAGHWAAFVRSAATSGPPKHQAAAGGHAWNGPASYQAPPLHLAPGATNQQYGEDMESLEVVMALLQGQGGSSTAWNAQTYPGSHYPGYTDQQYIERRVAAAAAALLLVTATSLLCHISSSLRRRKLSKPGC